MSRSKNTAKNGLRAEFIIDISLVGSTQISKIFSERNLTMTRTKKPHRKKHIPPHKRIPFEFPLLTRSARDLYDLIFSFGLGGCWMSNQTLAAKLGVHKCTVQRARQQLVKSQLIVTARTCPRTWIMWSRFHRAVQNCQVLLYPVRQKMDNPWYVLSPQSVGVAKTKSWGSKMLPKSDVSSLTGTYRKSLEKESAKRPPTTPNLEALPQTPPAPAAGPAPIGSGKEPEKKSLSADDKLKFKKGTADEESREEKTEFEQKSQTEKTTVQKTTRLVTPELTPGEHFRYLDLVKTFEALGYPGQIAANLAMNVIHEKREKEIHVQ